MIEQYLQALNTPEWCRTPWEDWLIATGGTLLLVAAIGAVLLVHVAARAWRRRRGRRGR